MSRAVLIARATQEYCCHKVDKVRRSVSEVSFPTNRSFQRISEIIKRKNKQRLAKAKALAKKEAAGDFSHLKNKKGELIAQPLPRPTLPNVSLDDLDDTSSTRKGGVAPSVYTTTTTTATANDYYYNKEYGTDYPPNDYPPMPGYGQQYPYNPSVGTLPDEQHYDDNDYGSTANLALSAAPMADDPRGNVMSPRPTYPEQPQQQAYFNDQYAYAADPSAAYRSQTPASNVAYGQAYTADVPYGDTHHDNGAQYHHQQASYGYPPHDGQPGGGGYDYNAGPARAM